MASRDADRRSTSRWLRGLLVVPVLLVALFLRTCDLDRVPPGLDGDEMFNAWDGLQAWTRPFTVFVPTNYGSETLLIYLIALSTRLLGAGAWTVRLPSAVCGIIGLALTWALAKRLFNFRVAILTTALTAISVWPIMLNRVALRAGLQPVCQAAAVYGLWRALDERSNRWAVVAGVFAGLTLYTYTPSRAFPAVLVLWPLTALVNGRHLLRPNKKRLVLIGVIAVLVFAPLGLFALRHPEIYSQRVQAVDDELKQLLAGDFGPVLRSVYLTLRMFTQAGDWNWRYNPSGRPVFDKVTGGLFYLGLMVCLWRLRRPSYSLLLVWLPVMLLPGILSTASPSFWHSVGALTPIYLMPAIGADFVWQRVARWSRGFDRRGLVTRQGLPVVTALGLVLVGADTWHDYFVEWPRDPRVLHTYEADLAAAARYLSEYTPADTPAWVSSEYPGDLSRVVFELQSTYAGPVRWFSGDHVTVWPSGWGGQDVLLLFTRSSPPNPDALAVLSDYLIFQEDDAAGRPHLWVYRLPGEALADMPWRPAHAVSGRFAHDREILGYDVPAQVGRQTEVPVVVYWRVPSGFQYDRDDLPHSFVCLQDSAAGRCLKEASHYMVYPLWDWTVGDVVAERYVVPVPAYLPPQTTYFRIGMFTSVGEVSFADEERAGAPLLAGPVEVVGTASVDPRWDADTPTFNQDLALLDYHMPTELSPGSTLEAELRWQAMRSPGSDYVVRLELRDRATGELAASVDELLGSERHPTSRWASGEPVHVFPKLLAPPDLDSGDFDVYLVLSQAADRQAVASPYLLGTVSVSGRPHYFELPAPEHPLVADFGSSIRLLGFDLKRTAPTPGGEIEVVLYWQALDTVGQDYKVFVHLYHPTIPGGLPGQHDSPPGNGAFPTSSWLPGEVVTDPHLVAIESGADTGVSEIGVGLYVPSTGERVPVFVDGEPQPDNALIVAEVEIR